MPSTTFFNLPAEKREKLLAAALAEFARVPYPDASINKIIQAADIPRGSFYMYFQDKGDLFFYLLGAYGERLAAQMEQRLAQHGGDPFPAFLDLFDHIQSDYRDPAKDVMYRNIIAILRVNQNLGHELFFGKGGAAAFLARLSAQVDASRLSLSGDEDLADIVYILVQVTGPAVMNGILADDPGPARRQYANILNILRRGMAAKPPSPAASQ